MNKEEAIKALIEWEERIDKDFKRDCSLGSESVTYYDLKILLWLITSYLKQESL